MELLLKARGDRRWQISICRTAVDNRAAVRETLSVVFVRGLADADVAT